jgi:hypothetical protein
LIASTSKVRGREARVIWGILRAFIADYPPM